MTITKNSSIADVAAIVSGTLARAGIDVVLTGGACATLYSEGAYQSHDLDFILQAKARQQTLDDAMASIGFLREGDRFIINERRYSSNSLKGRSRSATTSTSTR